MAVARAESSCGPPLLGRLKVILYNITSHRLDYIINKIKARSKMFVEIVSFTKKRVPLHVMYHDI